MKYINLVRIKSIYLFEQSILILVLIQASPSRRRQTFSEWKDAKILEENGPSNEPMAWNVYDEQEPAPLSVHLGSRANQTLRTPVEMNSQDVRSLMDADLEVQWVDFKKVVGQLEHPENGASKKTESIDWNEKVCK